MFSANMLLIVVLLLWLRSDLMPLP